MSYFEIMQVISFWFCVTLWTLALAAGSAAVLIYLVASILDRIGVFTACALFVVWTFLVLPGLVYLYYPLDNWAASLGIN